MENQIALLKRFHTVTLSGEGITMTQTKYINKKGCVLFFVHISYRSLKIKVELISVMA